MSWDYTDFRELRYLRRSIDRVGYALMKIADKGHPPVYEVMPTIDESGEPLSIECPRCGMHLFVAGFGGECMQCGASLVIIPPEKDEPVKEDSLLTKDEESDNLMSWTKTQLF